MKCRHGDKWIECFQQAIDADRFADSCLENILSMLKNWFANRTSCQEDALDLCQELGLAISQYFRNFDTLRYKSAKSYVFTIARHVYVQYLKRRRSIPFLLDPRSENDDSKTIEIREAVMHCIERLPPRQRTVILHRDIEDLSPEEVMMKTDIPQRTQHHYRRKAYENLKKCLENQGFSE